jgi:hypothetical protein
MIEGHNRTGAMRRHSICAVMHARKIYNAAPFDPGGFITLFT